ncbi:MAG: hypothetical protein RBU45_05955 [Myxococcota bacterium]|jgi:hypothetical protein|nr:hypothetical protein [Myxococcota bacterium]
MKLRRFWKKALLGLLSAGSGAVIAACYGPIDDGAGTMVGWELISGRVSSQGTGVPGLEVCARFRELASACAVSSVDGNYLIEADSATFEAARRDGFLVSVRDTDGEANGGRFADYDRELEADLVLPVSMDITVVPAP